MDFEPTYTAEQEAFRTEVQSWLTENIPGGIQHPADSIDLTYEQYQLRRELGRRLGDQGWLWPTAPQEYGGGGLTVDPLGCPGGGNRRSQPLAPPLLRLRRTPRREFHPGMGFRRAEAGVSAQDIQGRNPDLAAAD